MKLLKASFILLFFCLLISSHAEASVECKMNFSFKTWSFIYKTGKGSGFLTCGKEKIPVVIKSHGGGATFGKSKIHGHASFTGVDKIADVFGSYATAQAHAGVIKSGNAQVLTKGDVSMSLTAVGKGIDLGIAFGSFEIRRSKR